MKNELINFRKSISRRGHRKIEDFIDLDWRLIDTVVSIFEKSHYPIAYRAFRRELAKAANIRLTDAGWYITDVLAFDPIINGEIVHVLDIGSNRVGYVVSITLIPQHFDLTLFISS